MPALPGFQVYLDRVKAMGGDQAPPEHQTQGDILAATLASPDAVSSADDAAVHRGPMYPNARPVGAFHQDEEPATTPQEIAARSVRDAILNAKNAEALRATAADAAKRNPKASAIGSPIGYLDAPPQDKNHLGKNDIAKKEVTATPGYRPAPADFLPDMPDRIAMYAQDMLSKTPTPPARNAGTMPNDLMYNNAVDFDTGEALFPTEIAKTDPKAPQLIYPTQKALTNSAGVLANKASPEMPLGVEEYDKMGAQMAAKKDVYQKQAQHLVDLLRAARIARGENPDTF